MNTAPNVIYEFGPFRIDPDRETLLRDGQPLAITPKAFEVLLALVRRSHELVAKDELLQAVWPGRVVEEANLSQCIFLLRRLLGDTPDERRYIVTLPGKGYRFAAQVRTLAPGEPDADVAGPREPPAIDAAVTAQPAEPRTRSAVRTLVFSVIGVLIIGAVALGVAVIIRRGALTQTTADIPAKSIAVLPFQNLSADKNNEYFVAGIQGLILTKLADIGGLKVIARTSTSMYASHPDDLDAIGQQLGVATILEGSVQKAGNQVLINVQMVEADTGAHIWAESYQRTLDNTFGVEGEVAEKVAAALQAKLSPAERTRVATALSADADANILFLRGEYFVRLGDINFDPANYQQAIPFYEQAVAKDPDFALARARLSYARSAVAWFGGSGDTRNLDVEARVEAERALALQPDLAEAHLALGYCDYWGNGDYAGALKAFAKALVLRPNDADALAATGYVLARQGRFDAASSALRQALALDPRNTHRIYWLGMTYMMAGRYAKAATQFQQAYALDPGDTAANIANSNAILHTSGDVARALAALQGGDPQAQFQRAMLLTLQRNYPKAIAVLDKIPDTSGNFASYSPRALQLAELYRLARDNERAHVLYAQALPQVRAQLTAMAGNPIQLSTVWSSIATAELGLGHTAAGVAAIAKSQALIVESGDHEYGPWYTEVNASLYAEAGHADLAVPLLAKALATPGIGDDYSPVLLWLDPAWDPIRHDPRFQALLKEYAKYKPAVVYPIPSASAPAGSASVSAASAR